MRFFTLIILIVSFSCNQNTKEQQTIDLLKNRLRERESRLTKMIQDSIRNSKLIKEATYLKKDLANCKTNAETEKKELKLRILPLFQMHEDELPGQDLERSWTGLFSNESGYYTKSVEVDFIRVNDPLLDSEDERTGWKPELKNESDSCLYLISGRSDNALYFLTPAFSSNPLFLIS